MIRKYVGLMLMGLFTVAILVDFTAIEGLCLWLMDHGEDLTTGTFLLRAFHNGMFLITLLVCLFYWNIYFSLQAEKKSQHKRRRKDWVAPIRNPFDTQGYLIPVPIAKARLAEVCATPGVPDAEVYVDPDPDIPKPYRTWYDAYMGLYTRLWALESDIDAEQLDIDSLREWCNYCWTRLTPEQQDCADRMRADAWKNTGQ